MKIILTSSGTFVTEQMPKYLDKKIEDYKVAYITTAGNVADSKDYMVNRKKRMNELNFDYEEIDLVDKNEKELKELLQEKDIIYVEGGNTFYLLKHAKLSGFDKVVKELLEEGKIYVGSSAGSYLACPSIKMCEWINRKNWDKYGLEDLTALNLVPFMMKVHTNSYSEDDMEKLQEMIKKGEHEVKLLNDNQALLVENNNVSLIEK